MNKQSVTSVILVLTVAVAACGVIETKPAAKAQAAYVQQIELLRHNRFVQLQSARAKERADLSLPKRKVLVYRGSLPTEIEVLRHTAFIRMRTARADAAAALAFPKRPRFILSGRSSAASQTMDIEVLRHNNYVNARAGRGAVEAGASGRP